MGEPRSVLRRSGLPQVGDVPFGASFCHLYDERADLLVVLASYLRAGLDDNELCLVVPGDVLPAAEVAHALCEALPGYEGYAASGQLQVVQADGGGLSGARFDETIVPFVDQAVLGGFDGLRVAVTAPAERPPAPIGRQAAPGAIHLLNVVALFCYARARLDAVAIMELVNTHHLALVRDGDGWTVLEGSKAWHATAALERVEERLHVLFRNMSEGFAFHRVVLDAEGRPCDYVFLEVNDAFSRLTGLAPERLLGRRATEVLPGIEHDPVDWIGRYGRVALTQQPERFEACSAALGRWYAVSAFSPHKGFFAVTFDDVTARVKAEESLKASLAEKEVLLKEVHHRVKNNLQIITSLVSLQMDGQAAPGLQALLGDVRDRVRTMALVHEKLYESNDLTAVEFGGYARSLLTHLWRVHGRQAAVFKVVPVLAYVPLSIAEAVPFGLILNELVTNALKHAFRERASGTVTISLSLDEQGTVSLQVRDDGVGLPPGLDWRTSRSLGLRLVNMLSGQLGGTFDVRPAEGGGTVFEVTFRPSRAEAHG